MTDTAAFWARWCAFVRDYTASDPHERDRLVAQVLRSGLDEALAAADTQPWTSLGDDGALALVDPADRLACEYHLVDASGIFDEFGYVWRNRELHWSFCAHREGQRQFIRHGWKDLRNPSPDFDLWWYWLTYLDPAAELVNPVVHYLAEGRHLGHATVPPVLPLRDVPGPPGPGGPRRVCLFAGFDGDGIIDDTAVTYVRELSRFSDVYYLADCQLEVGELEKLRPYTKRCWAIRHGRYDFGSYSMLARDLVGWDEIATYDELLLANDSAYLLRPLDEVFATMDARPAHWWGLQATDDDFTPGDQKRLGRRLRVDDLVTEARTTRPWRTSDCFHVGSYFLALRSEVVADPEFRRRLNVVAGQTQKNSIIRKYEIGISQYLTLAGYHVETFIDGVLPFHPIYRESALGLVEEEGFPLLKRQFLHENPFDVPDLHRWKDRLLAAVPGADVAAMEENLWRVSPTFNLNRSLSVRKWPGQERPTEELIDVDNFYDLEHWVPRFDHWWVFPVNPRTGRLDGHARAVFEAVRDDPTIKKVLIGPTDSPGVGGVNVAAVRNETQAAQWYLLRAGTIFVNDGPRADVPHPLTPGKHRFVNVGRATSLRAFGARLPHRSEEELAVHRERLHDLDLTRAVCASSSQQSRALRPSVRSPHQPKRWVTGSPRADLLLGPEHALAPDLRAQLEVLRRACAGRRLVVWAPADRGSEPVPGLQDEQLHWWRDWAHVHDAVLGVRPPRRDLPSSPVPGLDPAKVRAAGLLVLSHRVVPDTEMVLREAAALVGDYTDDLLDFLVLDRPVAAFVPDLAAVLDEPGLVHDLAEVVPGPVCRDWDELRAAFDGFLSEPSEQQRSRHASVRDELHEHLDGRSASRVARRVQEGYLPIRRWLEEPAP